MPCTVAFALLLLLPVLLQVALCKLPQKLDKACEASGTRLANETWSRFINVLVPNNDTYGFSRMKIEPAVRLAVDRHLRPWYKKGEIVVRYLDTPCDPVGAPVKAGLEYYQNKADLFVGPVCSVSLIPMVLINFKWKVPVISPGGIFSSLSEEQPSRVEKSNTIILSNIQTASVANFLLQIFHVQQWKKFIFLYDWDGPAWAETVYCQLMKSAIVAEAKNKNWHGYFSSAYEWFRNATDAWQKLEQHVASHYSIVALCGDPDEIREILLHAYQKGFGNGEYLFVILDLHSSEMRLRRQWYRDSDSAEKNELSRQAFRNVWIVGSVRPTNADVRALMNITVSEYRKVVKSDVDVQEMWNYVAPFYDSIVLYSAALKATLQLFNISAGNTRNSSKKTVPVPVNMNFHISAYLINRTFDGIGGPIRMNENGTRVTLYQLLVPNTSSDLFHAVATFQSDSRQMMILQNSTKNWTNGRIRDTPSCGYDNSVCAQFSFAPEWVLVLIAVGFSTSVALPLGVKYMKVKRRRRKLSNLNWRIRWEDIGKFYLNESDNTDVCIASLELSAVTGSGTGTGTGTDSASTSERHANETMRRISSFARVSLEGPPRTRSQRSTKLSSPRLVGIYHSTVVSFKFISQSRVEVDSALIQQMCRIKELHSDHLCRFFGLCLDGPEACAVFEYCHRGTLREILESETIKLDWLFQLSFLQDIVRGMKYLHSNYGPHGNLTSSSCQVDTRFVVKVADFGFRSLLTRQKLVDRTSVLRTRKCSRCGLTDSLSLNKCKRCRSSTSNSAVQRDSGHSNLENRLYWAPEYARNCAKPTNEADVYSFAIIFQEVVYRKGPFYIADSNLTTELILIKVANAHNQVLRPTLNVADVAKLVHDNAASRLIVSLVWRSWAEVANERPSFYWLDAALRKLPDGDIDAIDSLLRRMKQYTDNLEALVEERTRDYLVEKEKAERLLYAILPRSVALQLIRNEPIQPESYDSVTIYLSDICGFTALSANSSAMDIVMMLNDLYTLFDSIIVHLDVYKVETIGDAYMVVSGLPERNGNVHAREIARLSLRIMEAVQAFKIRHKPDSPLRVRVGVHTGPVCAGVVGLKMPRFCLFGDTVSIASQMENSSTPMRVHVSQSTKSILDTFGMFVLEEGDELQAHNGVWQTWWLLAECDPQQFLTSVDVMEFT